ncbi:peptide chain release factor N(5)-glutamine methyltransferase [Candidatus Soleaferrea massiliensis]|uniref:peptide chain release factor N(5)-glutamine methyltransferase n=1 Tax=Candidatus Soleaferrea massiliensis TaxID=1470354 RepID=UPI00058BCCFD|nr:peptide chain release factor N(5)-glutamine methyltransferase [Candidatus Soleaferrea massiliensis]
MTIKQIHKEITDKLSNAGISVPAFESFVLLDALFGISKTDLLTRPDTCFPPEDYDRLQGILRERMSGRPLQYILGEWEFFGRTFLVGEGVLIPRPDTETVIEACLASLRCKSRPVIADLCSGSGCIAVTLAKELPDASIYALEYSDAAFAYLKKNIDLHRADCVTPLLADVLSADAPSLLPNLDLIVSNPPYIDPAEKPHLQPEVQHEPDMALFAPENGLLFYREITRLYRDLLKDNGHLIFEIGYTQADAVTGILKDAGFQQIRIIQDFSRNDRVVSGVKK